MTLSLVDDGTMDTVFQCSECGKEERYSSEGISRDWDGSVSEHALETAEEEHECETET